MDMVSKNGNRRLAFHAIGYQQYGAAAEELITKKKKIANGKKTLYTRTINIELVVNANRQALFYIEGIEVVLPEYQRAKIDR